MGGIAIWGMHYIGNRAILLANGDDALQIAYNPAFTVVSFFVPIMVLLAAFITVGFNEQVSFVRVSLGGALAGLSICGMHYLGQAGISNYTCVYSVPNVVGSGAIAVVATISALTIFFILRSIWMSSWYKRGMTAIILAGAVSGMHWLAEAGTQYRLKSDALLIVTLSRSSIVIVVIVLVCTPWGSPERKLTHLVYFCQSNLTCFHNTRAKNEISVSESSSACRSCCRRL
jgi:NO-binding membrane sensor protein with MHYT domain